MALCAINKEKGGNGDGLRRCQIFQIWQKRAGINGILPFAVLQAEVSAGGFFRHPYLAQRRLSADDDFAAFGSFNFQNAATAKIIGIGIVHQRFNLAKQRIANMMISTFVHRFIHSQDSTAYLEFPQRNERESNDGNHISQIPLVFPACSIPIFVSYGTQLMVAMANYENGVAVVICADKHIIIEIPKSVVVK